MSNNFAEDRKAFKFERTENDRQLSEDAAINDFFRRHADVISDCTASWRAVIDYFCGDPVTSEALESSWTNHPAFRSMLATHTPDEDRQTLERKIQELLSRGTSAQAVKFQSGKFKYKSNEELRRWCAELEMRYVMQQIGRAHV